MKTVLCCSVPLKQWKCSFEETLQSQCVSDVLPAIAAVFAESRLFHEIHTYVTAQRDTSVIKCSGTAQVLCDKADNEQLTLSETNKDANMSCVISEHTTTHSYTQLLTADVQLTPAGGVSKCVNDSAVDNDVSVTDGTSLNNDVSVMNQTMTTVLNQQKSQSQCRRTRDKSSASKIKQVCSRRKSKRASSDKKLDKTSTGDNSTLAGITHNSCHFSVICSQFCN